MTRFCFSVLPMLALVCAAPNFARSENTVGVGQTRFTVPDSIDWTRILNLSASDVANGLDEPALFSPDRSRFIVHLRTGDLQSNTLVERLLLLSTKDVERFATSSNDSESPKPTELLRFDVQRPEGLLSRIQWIDQHHIGFIADTDAGINQAFVVDTQSGVLSQATHSKTPVSSFGFSEKALLYYAYQPLVPQPEIGIIGDQPIGSVLFPKSPNEPPSELFQVNRASGVPQSVQGSVAQLLDFSQDVWLSPSGRFAIVFQPAANAPAYWSRYRIPDYERFGFTAANLRTDPTSTDLLLKTRYALVDLEKNTVRPLLDGPSGFLSNNLTPRAAYWLADEKSVVVTNTYLPLNIEGSAEVARRALTPAVAEVDIASGRALPVFWESALSNEERVQGKILKFRILGFGWDPHSSTLSIKLRHRKSRADPFVYETFDLKKRPGSWKQTPTRPTSTGESLLVTTEEGLNQRQALYVRYRGSRKKLLDPNPQADKFRFGRIESVTWTDSENAIEWHGGLVYPVDYAPGHKYPLIVQTHGFNPTEFLLDGPGGATTAFAAQAFANAGFVVLQVEENPRAQTDNEQEGPLYATGIHSGIQSLLSRGLVEPGKVGYIGWSRTGFHGIYLLGRYPDALLAASICDSVQPGYLQSVVLPVNGAQDTIQSVQRMVGVEPDFSRIGEWFGKSPLYTIQKSSAAVRLEADTGGPDRAGASILGLWETYAVLRSSGRPVELVYFRNGSHNQVMPRERLASQGGNVDWFRFWLQGYEDPDGRKVEQYLRWRALRAQRDAAIRAH